MSLWTLLIFVSSAGFFGSALGAAYATSGSVRGFVVAAIVGLLMATSNAWTWSKIGDAVDDYVRPLVESQQERYLRAVYLAAAVWVLCAGLLGGLIASAILRLAL